MATSSLWLRWSRSPWALMPSLLRNGSQDQQPPLPGPIAELWRAARTRDTDTHRSRADSRSVGCPSPDEPMGTLARGEDMRFRFGIATVVILMILPPPVLVR